MSEDPENAGSAEDAKPHSAGNEPKSSSRRLPPPAFPPGARRPQHDSPKSRPEAEEALYSAGDPVSERRLVPEDAFISPDEPIPERSQVPEDAFISPDEPIVRQHPLDEIDPNEVVVTGIGDDAHMEPRDFAVLGDPHVVDLVEKVTKLAEALKRKGEAGLHTDPGMSRFEATLRAYCVGYLAGRRVDDKP